MAMHGNELVRPKQGFMQMLRPQNMSAAAQTAITWFKPPLHLDPANGIPVATNSLGRMGPLEVRLAQDKRDVKRA
jgi:hypothetical protein